MRAVRLRAARRRGAETLEFLLTAMVMMIITVGCVLITNAYGNALATQHALSQTALYVAANGRYTVHLERECERMLPTTSAESTCRAERVQDGRVVGQITPAPNSTAAAPMPFGQHLRVSVTYAQPWFEICIPGMTACVGGVDLAIQRSIDIPSLTREVR